MTQTVQLQYTALNPLGIEIICPGKLSDFTFSSTCHITKVHIYSACSSFVIIIRRDNERVSMLLYGAKSTIITVNDKDLHTRHLRVHLAAC